MTRYLSRGDDDRPGHEVGERDLHHRSLSAPFSARRFASRTSTARVRNEVAVGTERPSFIAWASIAAGPRSGTTAPPSAPPAGRPAPSPFAAASTSAFDHLSPGAEPRTAPRSTPLAAATRRATGGGAGAVGRAGGGGGRGSRRVRPAPAPSDGARRARAPSPPAPGRPAPSCPGLRQDPGDRPTRRGRHLGVDLVLVETSTTARPGGNLISSLAVPFREPCPRSPIRPSRASNFE